MTKEKKIERLKLILSGSKLFAIKKNPFELRKGFNMEIVKGSEDDDEIIFDNINDAFFIITNTIRISNKSELTIKKDLFELCKHNDTDPNKPFSIKFSIN